jgi:hypothetical protein
MGDRFYGTADLIGWCQELPTAPEGQPEGLQRHGQDDNGCLRQRLDLLSGGRRTDRQAGTDAYFGGYGKPANHQENRRDLRLAENQTGKHRCVGVVRQRAGGTATAVIPGEAAAPAFVRRKVARARRRLRPSSGARSRAAA